ncbi:hypothetical protein [Rhizobium oryzihabitans]|nr:hypothetical protein [Rhizobium oryzihabitans]
MTYDIEIQIEELRAELRNACDAGERRQIQAELDAAQAELDALVDEEPPH